MTAEIVPVPALWQIVAAERWPSAQEVQREALKPLQRATPYPGSGCCAPVVAFATVTCNSSNEGEKR